ncbi:pilus assembly protein PilM, partial [bacterium]|nr:pilus assembly protein PilM [bacterium]
MRNSFVGLDIGYDSIKVIELKRDKAGLVATNCVIEPIEYDDVKNYSEEKVAEAIARALKNPSIKDSSVVVSLSGQSVFTRFIKFPTLDRSKIDQIVQFEAQQQVPFPIDDVIWDYQLLGDWATIDDIDEASVALVASKKEVITGLLENFESLKMDIEYIDIAPFALCNCIKFNEPALDGCTLVLDIGAKSTDMLVMEKDTVWLRNIPIGGIAMTQAVQKEFKVTFKEAEFLKKKYSVILCGDGPMVGESPERLRISRALTATMTRLLAEIS